MAAMASEPGQTRGCRKVHEAGDGTHGQHDGAGALSVPRLVLFHHRRLAETVFRNTRSSSLATPQIALVRTTLPTCYTQLRNAPKAVEAAQHAVEIVPKGVGQRLNLAFISSFAGDFAAGEREARTALSINPRPRRDILVLAEAQLGQGQIDKAAETYHKLENFGPRGHFDRNRWTRRSCVLSRQVCRGSANPRRREPLPMWRPRTPTTPRGSYVALGKHRGDTGKACGPALSDTDKALANSQSIPIEFLAARTYVDAGEIAKAQKLATSLSASLTNESQAYGKIIDGMIALSGKTTNEAIRQITAANNLLDTWIGRFDLGRAYLEAGAFTEADSEFDQCMKRRGEAIELFEDNVPTYAYFPAVYYYQGRAREGMKSAGFADFYKTYLSIRGQSTDDPLVADIRHRLGQLERFRKYSVQ